MNLALVRDTQMFVIGMLKNNFFVIVLLPYHQIMANCFALICKNTILQILGFDSQNYRVSRENDYNYCTVVVTISLLTLYFESFLRLSLTKDTYTEHKKPT